MRSFAVAALLLAAVPGAAEKTPKPPDVTVSEFSAARTGGLIEIEATFKNTGLKPLIGAEIVLHVFNSSHEPVSTQRARLDDTSIEPGDESQLHAQMSDDARAATVEVGAVNGNGSELRVSKPGPYTIE